MKLRRNIIKKNSIKASHDVKKPSIVLKNKKTVKSKANGINPSSREPKKPSQTKRKVVLKPVLGREKEYEEISKRVESFIKTGIGSVLYVTGVPGSGKTHTITNLLKDMDLDSVFINCATLKSRSGVYKKICEKLFCMPKRSLKTIQAIRSHFIECEHHHIIVIDEIDFLHTKNEAIFYTLFELPFIDNSKVMLIGISNTLSVCSTKIESRIGKDRIEFKPYTSTQLKEIIEIDSPATINTKTLDFIAKRIASSTGDIRRVKELVESSKNMGLGEIGGLIKEVNKPLLTMFIENLTFFQKLAVHANDKAVNDLMEWFNAFKSICKIKNIPELDFMSFKETVETLVEFGIYIRKTNLLTFTLNFLDAEIEDATKNDPDFIAFRNNKVN